MNKQSKVDLAFNTIGIGVLLLAFLGFLYIVYSLADRFWAWSAQ